MFASLFYLVAALWPPYDQEQRIDTHHGLLERRLSSAGLDDDAGSRLRAGGGLGESSFGTVGSRTHLTIHGSKSVSGCILHRSFANWELAMNEVWSNAVIVAMPDAPHRWRIGRGGD